jgi:hypothetical protein
MDKLFYRSLRQAHKKVLKWSCYVNIIKKMIFNLMVIGMFCLKMQGSAPQPQLQVAPTERSIAHSLLMQATAVSASSSALACGKEKSAAHSSESSPSVASSSSASAASMASTAVVKKRTTCIYACNLCLFTHESQSYMQMHGDTHSNNSKEASKSFYPYECNICKIRFNKEAWLNMHTRKNLCKMASKQASSVQSTELGAISKDHNESNSSFDKRKQEKSKLLDDESVELDEISAEDCDFETLQKYCKGKIVDGEKKFECIWPNNENEICGKVFSYSSSARRHVKCVHLNQKDYKCEKCEHCFLEKRHLEKHKKTKKYLSDRCGKKRKHTIEDTLSEDSSSTNSEDNSQESGSASASSTQNQKAQKKRKVAKETQDVLPHDNEQPAPTQLLVTHALTPQLQASNEQAAESIQALESMSSASSSASATSATYHDLAQSDLEFNDFLKASYPSNNNYDAQIATTSCLSSSSGTPLAGSASASTESSSDIFADLPDLGIDVSLS